MEMKKIEISKMFLFMNPFFNENKILGVIIDNETKIVGIDFSGAFSENNIPLRKFPSGGAYCNYNNLIIIYYISWWRRKSKGNRKIIFKNFNFKKLRSKIRKNARNENIGIIHDCK